MCDRVIERQFAEAIMEHTGLSAKQVARGMGELRDKGIIVPVIRKTHAGAKRLDRSSFGHVAQYCFTPDAWELIEPSLAGR